MHTYIYKCICSICIYHLVGSEFKLNVIVNDKLITFFSIIIDQDTSYTINI